MNLSNSSMELNGTLKDLPRPVGGDESGLERSREPGFRRASLATHRRAQSARRCEQWSGSLRSSKESSTSVSEPRQESYPASSIPQHPNDRFFLMTEPILISRQREILRDLHALIAERARLEPTVDAEFATRNEAAEKEFQASCQSVISRFESEKDSSQNEFQTTEHRVRKRFDTERLAQDKEFHDAQQRITGQFEAENAAAKDEYQKAPR